MVIPVGAQNGLQKFLKIEKIDGKIHEKNVLSVRYVPLTDLDDQLNN